MTSIAIREEHLALRDSVRAWCERKRTREAARALLDVADEPLPSFWNELATQGWLGLCIDERHGGSGAGLLELAIVLEEFGRALLPGPFLPTVLVAELLRAAAFDDEGTLAGITRGEVVAAVGLDAGTLRMEDGTLHGESGPVLGGGAAHVIVVPAGDTAGDTWVLVDAAAVTVNAHKSLDETRRVVTITADGARARAQLGIVRGTVDRIAGTLVAAECTGIAQWCLATAVEYAKVREQFGRPIGQFQGVKHRCANMLVAVEEARATAWDAARAPGDAPDELFAANVAAALALDAAYACAKDCIQVLGGVGFTWSHDAHLYLKRATSMLHLMGGSARFRDRVTDLALAGARRTFTLELPPDAERIRDEVRAFADSVKDLDHVALRAALADDGYIVPEWPRPWGRDAGAVEQIVIHECFAAAGIRTPHLIVGAWALPTIIIHGTEEQKERFVRPSMLGVIAWCQLFSEPDAGSDLAALTTKATRTDGGWLLTGQKIWTSLTDHAQWGICLARTNPDAPKHGGITYFLVEMSSPGIEIRTLRELTGNAHFSEVFLSDVFVPDDRVVGDVDGGWELARTTLSNERVAMSGLASLDGSVENLLATTLRLERAHDAEVRAHLGRILADAHALAVASVRTASRAIGGVAPGPEASVTKLLGAEHQQRVYETGLALLGPRATIAEGDALAWIWGFLFNRCLTIAGGTSEIQRNVIAERILGLPRDP